VLRGRARVARDRLTARLAQGDRAGDAVRAVARDLDRRGTPAVVVDVVARLDAVDGVGERAGRAVPHGADDLVHPPAARVHERLTAGVKHPGQPVGTQPRVLADAAVVQDGELLADVGVAAVRDAVWALGVTEPGIDVAAVAEGLRCRRTAPAQCHLRTRREGPTQPVTQLLDVGHQVRPVSLELDARLQRSL
jgi:hypothetical protein